jgi:hypothetical protein
MAWEDQKSLLVITMTVGITANFLEGGNGKSHQSFQPLAWHQ